MSEATCVDPCYCHGNHPTPHTFGPDCRGYGLTAAMADFLARLEANDPEAIEQLTRMLSDDDA